MRIILFLCMIFSISLVNADGLIDNDATNDILISTQDGLHIEPKGGVNAGKQYIVTIDVGNGRLRLAEKGGANISASGYHNFIDSFFRLYDYIDLHNGNIILIGMDTNNSNLYVMFQGLNLNSESFYSNDGGISTDNSLGNEIETMLVSNGTDDFLSIFPRNSTPNSGFCFNTSSPERESCNSLGINTNYGSSDSMVMSFPRSFNAYTDLERRNNINIYNGLFFSIDSVNNIYFHKYDYNNNISQEKTYALSPSVIYSQIKVFFQEYNISTEDYFFSVSSNINGIENINYNFNSDILNIYSTDSDNFFYYVDVNDFHKIEKNSYIFANVNLQAKKPMVTLIEENGLNKYYYYNSGNWYVPNVGPNYSYGDISNIQDRNDIVSNNGSGGSGGSSTGTGGVISVGNSNVDIGGIFDLDLDGDGEVGYLEAIRGIGQIPGKIIAQAGDYIQVLSDFISSITDREEPEYKDILSYIIPSAQAGFFTEAFSKVGEENKGTIVGKYSSIIRYGLYFFLTVVVLGLYIYQRNNNG